MLFLAPQTFGEHVPVPIHRKTSTAGPVLVPRDAVSSQVKAVLLITVPRAQCSSGKPPNLLPCAYPPCCPALISALWFEGSSGGL